MGLVRARILNENICSPVVSDPIRERIARGKHYELEARLPLSPPYLFFLFVIQQCCLMPAYFEELPRLNSKARYVRKLNMLGPNHFSFPSGLHSDPA